MLFSWFNNVKIKATLEQATKPYSFFNLGTRWGGWTSRPGRFTPRKETRYPLYRGLGGPQGRSGRVRKILPPIGIRSPDRPARRE